MYCSTGIALLTLATNALAQGVCNADNCLRAIRANNAFPYPSSASKDCMVFFSKTVIFVPSVTTSTITATRTASQVSVTTTIPTSVTSTATGSASVTTILTQIVSTTTTLTVPYTVTLTDVPVITITDNAFVYVTTTTTAACANQKRVLGRNSEDNIIRWTKPGYNLTFVDAKLAVRAAPAFATTTVIPTIVPTYASACSGVSRYSSACSCIGISMKTNTITLPTPTSYTTSYATVTPITTKLTTSTSTAIFTVTSTQTIQVTSAITSSITATSSIGTTTTATSTSFATVSFTYTLTNTATASATDCPAPAPTCSDSPQGVQEQCDSGNTCNQPSNCSVVSSYDACENHALSDVSVDAFQYDGNNGDCILYYECCPEDF